MLIEYFQEESHNNFVKMEEDAIDKYYEKLNWIILPNEIKPICSMKRQNDVKNKIIKEYFNNEKEFEEEIKKINNKLENCAKYYINISDIEVLDFQHVYWDITFKGKKRKIIDDIYYKQINLFNSIKDERYHFEYFLSSNDPNKIVILEKILNLQKKLVEVKNEGIFENYYNKYYYEISKLYREYLIKYKSILKKVEVGKEVKYENYRIGGKMIKDNKNSR